LALFIAEERELRKAKLISKRKQGWAARMLQECENAI
jgi:hypothetical protein